MREKRPTAGGGSGHGRIRVPHRKTSSRHSNWAVLSRKFPAGGAILERSHLGQDIAPWIPLPSGQRAEGQGPSGSPWLTEFTRMAARQFVHLLAFEMVDPDAADLQGGGEP